MARLLPLNKDPRWHRLVELYAFNQPRFAVDVCGMTPDEATGKKGITWQQIELGNEISVPGCRVSVSSGHGTGKTRFMGVTALWHLACYFKSNTIFTAPKIDQLQKQCWQEIADMHAAMKEGPFAWLAEHIIIKDKSVYIRGYKKSWWVTARTAPKGSPENLAGAHRDWLLIWADEASGIPDPNFGVLNGAMSDARNRFVLTSQPTKPAGYFYDTHHKLSEAERGPWKALRFSSEESPLVSDESIQNWILEYEGRDSVLYGIKVLGLFPDKADGFLIGRKEIEACFGRSVIDTETDYYGIVLSTDVGAGEYRDNSVLTVAFVSGHGEYGPSARRVQIKKVPVRTNTANIKDFTGMVFHVSAELENTTNLVDVGGMGIAVYQSLEELGAIVHKVRWGQPPWRKESQAKYMNLRAQATVGAARAIREGRLGIDVDVPNKNHIISQASRIPYHFDEKARYVIEKKEEMRKQGIPSPDDFDTVCFYFLEDYDFMLVENRAHNALGDDSNDTPMSKLAALAAEALGDLEQEGVEE